MARSGLINMAAAAILTGAIFQGCASTEQVVEPTAVPAEVTRGPAPEPSPDPGLNCDGFQLPSAPAPRSEAASVEWTGSVTEDKVCRSRVSVSLVPGDKDALGVPQVPRGHAAAIQDNVTWLMRMLTQATPRLVATLENPELASIPGGQVKLDVDVSVAEESSWTGRAASWGGQLARHLADLQKGSLDANLAVDAGWICLDLRGLNLDLGLPPTSLALQPLKVRVARSVLETMEITAPVQNLDSMVILEDDKGRALEQQPDAFPGRVKVVADGCGCDHFIHVRPSRTEPYKRHVTFGPKDGRAWAQARGLRVVFGIPGGGIPTWVQSTELPQPEEGAKDATATYTRLVQSLYESPVIAVAPRVGYDNKSLRVSLKRGKIATTLSAEAREALDAVKRLNEGEEPLDNVCLRGANDVVLGSFGLAGKERSNFYRALDGVGGAPASVVVDLSKTGLATQGFALTSLKGAGEEGEEEDGGKLLDALLREMRAERPGAMKASLPRKPLRDRTGYVRLPLARREGLAKGLQYLDVRAYLSGAVTIEASDVILFKHPEVVAELPLVAIPPEAIDEVVTALTTPWGMLRDRQVSVDAFNVLWPPVEAPYGPGEHEMVVLALDYAGNVLARGQGRLTYRVLAKRSDRAKCTIDLIDRGAASESVALDFSGPARPELVKKFQVVNQGTHLIQQRYRPSKKCSARAEPGADGVSHVACTDL